MSGFSAENIEEDDDKKWATFITTYSPSSLVYESS